MYHLSNARGSFHFLHISVRGTLHIAMVILCDLMKKKQKKKKIRTTKTTFFCKTHLNQFYLTLCEYSNLSSGSSALREEQVKLKDPPLPTNTEIRASQHWQIHVCSFFFMRRLCLRHSRHPTAVTRHSLHAVFHAFQIDWCWKMNQKRFVLFTAISFEMVPTLFGIWYSTQRRIKGKGMLQPISI